MPRKKIVVQKFGGTSVANVKRIQNVAKRVVGYKKNGFLPVVVVSALGDTTDKLVNLSAKITDEPPEREMDMLISTGEQVSCALLAMAIDALGYPVISFTGAQVGIVTDKTHTKARIVSISTQRIKNALEEGNIVVVAGFQGMTEENDITTLGRGGSDLTAVALAKSLNADLCEIYTDVGGIYTTDPRITRKARMISKITYDEMLEMASLGAQIMQSRSIELAKKFDIPIHVRSSFTNKEGTMIKKTKENIEGIVITGITLDKSEAKCTIRDVPDRPGIAAKIFGIVSRAGIDVDMIVQNISRTRMTDLSFTIKRVDLKKAEKVMKYVAKKIGIGEVLFDADIARVSVVGVGMKSHPGVAAKMFQALAEKKINIEMISTSEISISCLVKKPQGKNAVKALHKKFRLNK